MNPLRRTGRRCRGLFPAVAAALVMVVAAPAALAAYTGSYTPTQAIAPRQLTTPASFACTAPGNNSVQLTWTDADSSTADPYAASTFVISGYVVERQLNSGSWTQLATPARTATSASDSGNFGLLGLGDHVHYRMRSIRSNWVSADTATLTATVTSVLIFVHVTCP